MVENQDVIVGHFEVVESFQQPAHSNRHFAHGQSGPYVHYFLFAITVPIGSVWFLNLSHQRSETCINECGVLYGRYRKKDLHGVVR